VFHLTKCKASPVQQSAIARSDRSVWVYTVESQCGHLYIWLSWKPLRCAAFSTICACHSRLGGKISSCRPQVIIINAMVDVHDGNA